MGIVSVVTYADEEDVTVYVVVEHTVDVVRLQYPLPVGDVPGAGEEGLLDADAL